MAYFKPLRSDPSVGLPVEDTSASNFRIRLSSSLEKAPKLNEVPAKRNEQTEIKYILSNAPLFEAMGPKKQTKNATPSPDPNGMFSGMSAFLVETDVQPRRLQIWKLKLVQMGATLEDRFSKNVTHVFAANFPSLLRRVDRSRLHRFKGRVLLYQWLEDSLRLGEKVSEDLYGLQIDAEGEEGEIHKSMVKPEDDGNVSGTNEFSPQKRTRASCEADSRNDAGTDAPGEVPSSPGGNGDSSRFLSPAGSTSPRSPSMPEKDLSLLYKPFDLNRNITEIFGKLTNIYRALGDDRRSFSYYKAIPVIEKLPFKIENSDQVKNQPGIGKSIQDHIQEIVTTGKLSKLEHFETDEKVRTISLFGEIWGIGPATALKLYEKGYRTLEDLKNEDSLTYSQKIGLKYFDDIRTRIPRYEAEDMGKLLQKIGEEIFPGVIIVCGGSYRRGKASCGDLDVVITHPDGQSHKGFLPKFVKRLKEINFLREDLIFSSHSEEGTDSGVDTYFGLCTYPGRELRHRVDLKVYPRNIYAFGLIAWTGNDVLNRRLRLLAESRGYRMDDTGLYPATQASGGNRGVKGTASLKFDTEKEVFDFLGFPWLEPHERNL